MARMLRVQPSHVHISSDSLHKTICRERVVRGREDVIMRAVAQECFMEDVKGGMKRARSAAISSRGFSEHLVWLLVRWARENWQ